MDTYFHSLTLLRNISLRWGVIYPLLDKIKLDFPTDILFRWLLFVYASDENDVVVFIQPTLEIVYTPEAEIPDYEVVDTMGDDILESME